MDLQGDRVRLRPLAPEHRDALLAIRAQQEVADWWGQPEPGFPDEEPTAVRFTVLLDDRVTGMVQFTEEADPDYRHAEVDIFLDADRLGEGLGPDALTTLIAHLVERGHHRVVLSANVHNRRAIRAYEKTGFRRVGITRRSGRDFRTGRYEDEVLMEWAIEPRDSA